MVSNIIAGLSLVISILALFWSVRSYNKSVQPIITIQLLLVDGYKLKLRLKNLGVTPATNIKLRNIEVLLDNHCVLNDDENYTFNLQELKERIEKNTYSLSFEQVIDLDVCWCNINVNQDFEEKGVKFDISYSFGKSNHVNSSEIIYAVEDIIPRLTVDTGLCGLIEKKEKDLSKINKSLLRIANYLDSCALVSCDDFDVLSPHTLITDLKALKENGATSFVEKDGMQMRENTLNENADIQIEGLIKQKEEMDRFNKKDKVVTKS